VLVVGAGGLGSSVALHLAAAGVGTLGVVDDDRVDVSNLHRQLLYGTRDVGRHKLAAAGDRLGDLNPHVRVERHQTRLTAANARALAADHDLVVDGTDNFAARYAVNDACAAAGVPTCTAASTGSRDGCRCSRPPAVRATGACTPSRPTQD
jgi:adenylyltransferase/sulfurtransferase